MQTLRIEFFFTSAVSVIVAKVTFIFEKNLSLIGSQKVATFSKNIVKLVSLRVGFQRLGSHIPVRFQP